MVMTRKKNVLIDDQNYIYACLLPDCMRGFTYEAGLITHCMTADQHGWCSTCRDAFSLTDGSQHEACHPHCSEMCEVCEEVFLTFEGLRAHHLRRGLPPKRNPNLHKNHSNQSGTDEIWDGPFGCRGFTASDQKFRHLETSSCLYTHPRFRDLYRDFLDQYQAGRLFSREVKTDKLICFCGEAFELVSDWIRHMYETSCSKDDLPPGGFEYFLFAALNANKTAAVLGGEGEQVGAFEEEVMKDEIKFEELEKRTRRLRPFTAHI